MVVSGHAGGIPLHRRAVDDRADLVKILAGRKIDIYSHREEKIVLAIRHEGLAPIHLFSNESYQFDHARNPAWRLDVGTYRLRVTVHYERGSAQDFELRNTGTSLDDAKIQMWSGKSK